jgi:hypothetical protein
MSTITSAGTPAKRSYYRLLQASFKRAERLLEEMNRYPEKYSPERRNETFAYLIQLQKEMAKLKIED